MAKSTMRKPTATTVAKSAKKIAGILAKHDKSDRKAIVKEANSIMRMVEKLLTVKA